MDSTIEAITAMFVALRDGLGPRGIWGLLFLSLVAAGLWFWWQRRGEQQEVARLIGAYEGRIRFLEAELRGERIARLMAGGQDVAAAEAVIDRMYPYAAPRALPAPPPVPDVDWLEKLRVKWRARV